MDIRSLSENEVHFLNTNIKELGNIIYDTDIYSSHWNIKYLGINLIKYVKDLNKNNRTLLKDIK